MAFAMDVSVTGEAISNPGSDLDRACHELNMLGLIVCVREEPGVWKYWKLTAQGKNYLRHNSLDPTSHEQTK